MAREKHQLNGAYYATPMCPPVNTYRRGADVGCILNILVVFIGIAALILWFTLRPNVVTFQVTEANLTRFDIEPQRNNLHYNLALNFSIYNPNRRIGIHYDQLEARGYYGDQRFAAVNLPSFYQGHNNTKVVKAEFNGQNLVLLDDGGRSDLSEDHESGVYTIDVKLKFKIRFKFLFLNSWAVKPKFKCHLKVPLGSSNAAGGFQFQPTKCHVDL